MFKLPAYFSGFGSRADGSASLRFASQELTPEQFAELKRSHNAFGWLLFSEADLNVNDIPSEKAEEDGISASERLRRRMFVFWKTKINEGDFETWRKQQLDTYGQRLLDKLN